MANREWTTRFFDDEPAPIPVEHSQTQPIWTGIWPGGGVVLWAFGEVPNELNSKNNKGILRQPEAVKSEVPLKDGKVLTIPDTVGWRLFVPSIIVAHAAYADAIGPPAAVIPVTLLLGRLDEDVGYGLRVFFERAGTGALLCLGGREGEDPGGRWNVGISQETIERIFTAVNLSGKPEVQVLAGYSTGYGVIQTINNELVPLAPVKRLIFFDCIYRSDHPDLPKNEPAPTLSLKDRPEFPNPPSGQLLRDEGKEPFLPSPFNTRRAIARLTSSAKGCIVAGYSATSGGSPRYAIWLPDLTEPKNRDKWKQLTLGTRPVVEIPELIELREGRVASGQSWSPSDAFDMLALCRYLALGIRTGLVEPGEPPPFFRAAIANGLPPRGTVVSSPITKSLVNPPASLPASPVDLLAWASSLPAKTKFWNGDRMKAATVVRSHELVLPGWEYDIKTDLDEFRHAATLSEFGWELLPP